MKYLGTIRVVFEAEDDVEARIDLNEVIEAASEVLDEDDTIDVTQIIPSELRREVEPAEMVAQMRLVRDMLIKTRIAQCFELAKEVDQMAWVLEHRNEASFDLSGYDYGSIFDRAKELLGASQQDR